MSWNDGPDARVPRLLLAVLALVLAVALVVTLTGCTIGSGQMKVVQAYPAGAAYVTDGIDYWMVNTTGNIKVGDCLECADKQAGCYQWRVVVCE
jgi:hypothetical protein